MSEGASFPGGDAPPFSELALVSSNTKVGTGVRIGPFSVVGREGAEAVVLGDNTIVGDHVLIEPGARIGADCSIENHCRIGAGSSIAAGSSVRSGVSKGSDATRRNAAPSPAATEGPEGRISGSALIASNVDLGADVEIGPFAIVGWAGEEDVRIGARTRISPFALIEPGVEIGEDCLIDAYCRVGAGTRIGDRTQILYGAAVFEDASIGRACIVGGNVADRTVIEDFVTHFGEIAHEYRDPGDLKAWDEVKADSPVIGTRSVVGQYAVIIGGRRIGPASYVAAGEIVKVDVPEGMFYQNGRLMPIAKTFGRVRARRDGLEP